MIVESISNGRITVTISEDSPKIIINSECPVIQGGGQSDHSQLENLDYASAGHTGFEPARGEDDNYVTDAEKTAIGTIGDKVDKVTGYSLIADSDILRLANTEGTNTGDQDLSPYAINDDVLHKNVSGEVYVFDQKDVLKMNDVTMIEDSDDEFSKKKTSFQKIYDLFKAGFDLVFEPKFEKNTAFNKNFGTTAGTVAEGSVIWDILTILQSI